MSNKCPKCGTKLSPFYLKPTCPKCGVNIMQYGFDERLEEDKVKAEREWSKLENSLLNIKKSTIGSPWTIIRLILFFTPLASMCLPLFWAGHKNVSLISFVMSIVNHGFDFKAIASEKSYLFAVLSIICVIVFSLVEIICSLFTAKESGYKRNIIAFSLNFIVLAVLSFLSIGFGAKAKIGLIITFLIYLAKFVLHNIVSKKGIKPYNIVIAVVIAGSIVASLFCFYHSNKVVYTAPKVENSDISAVTFNVASAFGTSFEDTDSMTRCIRFANYMNDIKPDLIGTQEINSYWLSELKTELKDYESYGVKRGGDSEEKNSEMNAVFWNKSKFSLLDKNTIWLSETPNKESKYTYLDENGKEAEAGCNRICTYVVLSENKTGKTLVFLNTHLDNASEQALNFGANVVCQKVGALKKEYGENVRIVLTGDFNSTMDSTAYKTIAKNLNDSTDLSKKTATYQEWGYCYTGDEPIDFIFTSGTPSNYTVLNDLNGGYISDHYGIFVGVRF